MGCLSVNAALFFTYIIDIEVNSKSIGNISRTARDGLPPRRRAGLLRPENMV